MLLTLSYSHLYSATTNSFRMLRSSPKTSGRCSPTSKRRSTLHDFNLHIYWKTFFGLFGNDFFSDMKENSSNYFYLTFWRRKRRENCVTRMFEIFVALQRWIFERVRCKFWLALNEITNLYFLSTRCQLQTLRQNVFAPAIFAQSHEEATPRDWQNVIHVHEMSKALRQREKAEGARTSSFTRREKAYTPVSLLR